MWVYHCKEQCYPCFDDEVLAEILALQAELAQQVRILWVRDAVKHRKG